MKNVLIIVLCISSLLSHAQIPGLNKLKKAADKVSDQKQNTETKPGQQSSSLNETPGRVAEKTENATTQKILFFNSPSAPDNVESAITTFKDGDFIYGKVLLDKPLGKYRRQNFYTFILHAFNGNEYINGLKLNFLTEEDFNKSVLEFQIISTPERATTPLAKLFTQTFAKQLSFGQHIIKIRLTSVDNFDNESVVAESEFEFAYPAGSTKLKQYAAQFDADKIESARMPKSAVKNEKVEKDFLVLIKDAFKEDITPLRVTLDFKDWSIIRNDLGVITGREYKGYVAIKINRNGNCFYRYTTIYQPYAGGGNYGKSQYYDSGYNVDLIQLNCANVNR